MKLYKMLAIIFFLGFVVVLILLSRGGSGKMVSSQGTSQNLPVVTLTPTPTPSPVIFNENSNLETETEKLTPEDFSVDYKSLKEEVGKF